MGRRIAGMIRGVGVGAARRLGSALRSAFGAMRQAGARLVRAARRAGRALMAAVKATPRAARRLARAAGLALAHFFRNLAVRTYALVLVLVLAWAGYAAVAYLVRTVFRPTHVPPRFLDWQGHLEASALRQGQVAGVSLRPARAPVGHYHAVDRWFQPDRHNGCAADGRDGQTGNAALGEPCHSPLPHSKSVELRAFANFHATFLACQTCHQAERNRPATVAWVGNATGRVQQAPAILQLLRYLQTELGKLRSEPRAAHAVIVGLLGQTVTAIGGDPLLDYLRLRIETSEPDSPVWRHAVNQLIAELPQHARGEYGAKLAPLTGGKPPTAQAGRLFELAKEFGSPDTNDGRRAEIRRQAHLGLTRLDDCRACHAPAPAGMLDFQSLGYSPERAKWLGQLPLAGQMQQIRRGQPFRLPRLLENADER